LKSWIILGHRRNGTINREAAGQHGGGSDAPVVFNRGVVDVGGECKTIAKIAVTKNGGNTAFVMMIAVTGGDVIFIREMMVDFNVVLAGRKLGQDRSMEIEIAGFGVRIRRLRIQIDDGLTDGIDEVGIDHVGNGEVGSISVGIDIEWIEDALRDRIAVVVEDLRIAKLALAFECGRNGGISLTGLFLWYLFKIDE